MRPAPCWSMTASSPPVPEADGDRIDTTVEVGGTISDNKGLNVPDVVVPIAALTDKDRSDLAFALEQGVDWIALVVRPAARGCRRSAHADRRRAALLAKIEKPAAIERLDEILELADGVMVARGDLGVELPPEDVPPLQKRIVAARGIGQAGGRRDADARIDDQLAVADPRRGLRRRHRDLRRRRCGHAVGRNAPRACPVESVAMMDRIATGRTRPDPLGAGSTSPRPGPTRPPPTRSPAPPGRSRRPSGDGDRVLHHFGLDRAAGGARAADGAADGADPLDAHRAAMGLLWGAHAVQTRDVVELRGDGRQGQAHGAAPRLRRGRRPGDHDRRRAVRKAPGSTNVLHVVRLIGDELKGYAGTRNSTD